jgi:hypothetical protein
MEKVKKVWLTGSSAAMTPGIDERSTAEKSLSQYVSQRDASILGSLGSPLCLITWGNAFFTARFSDQAHSVIGATHYTQAASDAASSIYVGYAVCNRRGAELTSPLTGSTSCTEFRIYCREEVGLGHGVFYAQLRDASHDPAATGATVADVGLAFTHIGGRVD